jgi:hypothetical protein
MNPPNVLRELCGFRRQYLEFMLYSNAGRTVYGLGGSSVLTAAS